MTATDCPTWCRGQHIIPGHHDRVLRSKATTNLRVLLQSVDGDVSVTLELENKLKMTPDGARQLAAALNKVADKADGKD